MNKLLQFMAFLDSHPWVVQLVMNIQKLSPELGDQIGQLVTTACQKENPSEWLRGALAAVRKWDSEAPRTVRVEVVDEREKTLNRRQR